MPNLARLGDPVSCPNDLHGFPPFQISIPVVGVFIQGSPNVFCNNRPAVRVGDAGIHVICPGPNSFNATSGSVSVFINNQPAVRDNDQTLHCGLSPGHVIGGMTSPNTIVGG